MREDGAQRGFEMRPTDAGYVQMMANVEYEEILALLAEMRSHDLDVKARHATWAGPYEILLAVGEIIVAAGGVAGGVAAVLNLFAKENPDQPITIHFEDNSTTVITGSPIDPELEARINELFDKNREDPPEEYGSGTREI